jgi:hypothetical protein
VNSSLILEISAHRCLIYKNGKDSDSEEGERFNGKKTMKAKGSAPIAGKKDTSYYRILNVCFQEKHSPDVMNLGAQPTAAELDTMQFLHKDVFDKLIETYSDVVDEYIGKLAFTHLLAVASYPMFPTTLIEALLHS